MTPVDWLKFVKIAWIIWTVYFSVSGVIGLLMLLSNDNVNERISIFVSKIVFLAIANMFSLNNRGEGQ